MAAAQPKTTLCVPPLEWVADRIYAFRSARVVLDSDLAAPYGAETKNPNKAVKRNLARFPSDLAFQRTEEEHDILGFKAGTSGAGRGGRHHTPWALTEHSVAMLSSVLHTERAIAANITIMRTLARVRQVLAAHEDLARKVAEHDGQIAELYAQTDLLLAPPEAPKNPIGSRLYGTED